MRDEFEQTEADLRYEEACTAHYDIRDLALAIKLYRGVIDVFPNTLQAESARLQLLKIVDAVVPVMEILDTLQELAAAHLESEAPDGPRADEGRRRALRHEEDRDWDRREQERQHAEIRRRVKEHRRGPFI